MNNNEDIIINNTNDIKLDPKVKKYKIIIKILKWLIALIIIIGIITTIALVINNYRIIDETKKEEELAEVEPPLEELPEEELEVLLSREKSTITNLIRNRFSTETINYSIRSVKLYGMGQYAGVSLNYYSGNNSYIYYAVLEKIDGNWILIGFPELILSFNNYPNIPKEVIRRINTQE